MKYTKSQMLVLCALAVAINVALGALTSLWKLPLYLDTIGTVFIAIYFGPWYGAAVGATTNVLSSLVMGNIKGMPFLLVSVAIGIVVGLIARKRRWTLPVAIVTGLILSVVAPLIGTPIGVWVYGGLTGTVSDVVVLWLKTSGMNIFSASFLMKLFNNLWDKVGTCLLVYLLIRSLPRQYKPESEKQPG
ncbi:MAG: ECF transporter S component [Clostridium sp. SCN 57-10]|nr:MAG: ECF transporter S component [Clostridium sp. SCN 57-10]